jgi:hypothetical protein
MNEGINYPELLYQHSGHDIDILEKNAKENPFSSLASFLLLYHYKKNNHPGFERLAKKTALYFNNAHWLQFLLSDTPSGTENDILLKENLPGEQKKITEINSGDIKVSQVQNFNGIETEEPIINNENIETPERVDEIKTEAIPETLYEIHKEEPEALPQENSDNSNNYEIEKEKISETKDPDAGETIAFEPLHTVDYFASQGIKITDEPITTDKLSNQMKSFTQWLKSMKKLHPGKLEEQTVVNEKLIQSSAEESNINTEILTEAMAEVLIKQDKKEKAIEMFSKLSLINPSKSAYFAAKIESIKSS